MAAGLGLEPRLTAPKTAVLPLDDPAVRVSGLYPVTGESTLHPTTMSANRLNSVAQALRDHDVDALFVSSSNAIGYLHGLFESGHERFLTLALRANGDVALICPGLTVNQARRVGIADIRSWTDAEPPMVLFEALAKDWNLRTSVIGVEGQFRADHLLAMQHVLPAALFQPGDALMAAARARKDDQEIDALRRAGAVADTVWEATWPQLKVGMTEIEIQGLIQQQILQHGAEITFCSVASGPGSAEPHHANADRPLTAGDVVNIDFGCMLDHYQADITRCVAVGHASEKAREVYKVVFDAHHAGRNAVRPGATGQQVDAAARSVIEKAGYGEFFVHRTGHGIGLEVHELPNIGPTDTERILEPGNTFSIEPGIYLPGEFGVRIENIVACGVSGDGCLSLNAEPAAELQIVG